MKRFKFRKNKKAFTLAETVIALAVVGVISAIVLPLVSSSLFYYSASESLRESAYSAASSLNTSSASGLDTKRCNVKVTFTVLNDGGTSVNKAISGDSTFDFTVATVNGANEVQVTYSDLKYKED